MRLWTGGSTLMMDDPTIEEKKSRARCTLLRTLHSCPSLATRRCDQKTTSLTTAILILSRNRSDVISQMVYLEDGLGCVPNSISNSPLQEESRWISEESSGLPKLATKLLANIRITPPLGNPGCSLRLINVFIPPLTYIQLPLARVYGSPQCGRLLNISGHSIAFA